ncbi:MAG: hypothetical protein QOF56_4467 [Acidobacteriaceae bacterium]|nr:hypothetical protein [Acidobacteriaceae bacterium]
MNIISMMHEIYCIANPMIGKPAVPDFLIASDDRPEFMRVCSLDQPNSSLDSRVYRRSQQQMSVFGHDYGSVQFESAPVAIPINGLQKETHVSFDYKQYPSMMRRELCEGSFRRGDESSRLQGETSAAGSRTSPPSLTWHEWNSCPFRFNRVFSLGKSSGSSGNK